MSRLRAPQLAHIAQDVTSSTLALLLIGAGAVLLTVLVVEHNYVKHGRFLWRQTRLPVATIVALALGAVVAPSPGSAQSTIGPMGLPDLVSDPAFIWLEQVRTHPTDGRVFRTLAFDGILHNIGAGALEVSGNPQIEGDVTQRVFDGEEWTDVGTPLVQYETDDGHNHFHLMDAAAYTLWNEGQTEQVDVGEKVGFCLLDTMQIERGVDAEYLLDEINYCNVDEPDSTELRMGISPGWVDIYEASLTFQWVDTSNTVPGRYWVGSAIDPTDQIVESNEDNNGVVFSRNKYAVSGHNARELDVQEPGEIVLKSTAYGTTGNVAYVIVDPPEHGSLSVPTGYDVLGDTIDYVAEPGFEGTDSFSYYAHDVDVPFPFDPVVVQVDVQVDSDDGVVADDPADTQDVIITAPDEISTTRYERAEIAMTIDGTDIPVRWFAQDLPSGLTIDEASGLITGELTMPGDVTSTVLARIGETDFETTVDWTVADATASLRSINDFSTSLDRRDIVIGSGTAETQYSALGLPAGVLLTEGQPSILGTPTEIGEFDVVVIETRDGEVVDTVEFTLTVRPAAKPEFAL